jgi:hypothetical protein
MNTFEKLDKEHSSRIEKVLEAWQSGRGFKVQDVFHSAPVIPALDSPKVILPSFRLSEIYANYPFAPRLFVSLCPYCLKPEDFSAFKEVLIHSDVVPVLVGDYADYPPELTRFVLEFPHISRHEFAFYRFAKVYSMGSTAVCAHCVEERRRMIVEDANKMNSASEITEVVGSCVGNLHPFIDPDFQLLTILAEIVKKGDMAALKAIVGTSEMIHELRTCQAYNARSLLPIREVPKLLDGAAKVLPEAGELELAQISEVVSAPLGFSFGASTSPKEFFAVANEHRRSLAPIVEKIVQSSTKDGEIMLTHLSGQLGELNAELQSLRTNKRYLGYKAAFGFLRTNKVLVASTLVAGALGLAGSFLGCGVSLASGMGAKYGIRKLRQVGKLRATPETKAFLSQVKVSIRPHLHRLLASYTGVSVPAIQISEVAQDVEQRLKKMPPRKRSVVSSK